jgi:hypothetical protein
VPDLKVDANIAEVSKSPLPIAKRQAREEIYNDENANPFISAARNGDSMELDELSSTVSTRSRANEFKIKGKRVSLSPHEGTET